MTDKINGRTPEEIKYSYMMYRLCHANEWDEHCAGSLTLKGRVETVKWAHALIQQLEAERDELFGKVEQLEHEKDAYLRSMKGVCAMCKRRDYCLLNPLPFCDRWQWCGVPEGVKNDCL